VTEDARVRTRPDVERTEIDGEVLIVSADGLYYLDRSAAGVWRLLQQGSPKEVICHLERDHPEDASVGRDVRAMIDRLLGAGVIEYG
jgi:hypothetical protein